MILINGYACGAATATNTKRIDITGSTGTDTVILDYLGGTFAMGTATSAGVVIDLVSGSNDALKIRGSKAADAYVFGSTGLAINVDGNKDVTVANVDNFTVSLSDGVRCQNSIRRNTLGFSRVASRGNLRSEPA